MKLSWTTSIFLRIYSYFSQEKKTVWYISIDKNFSLKVVPFMGIGNSTARYRSGWRVVWSRYTRRVCIDWHTLAYERREGKGRKGKGVSLSLSRASLGDARHEIFKIQMATRIRSRALRLIRNFLNSNAFKLAPPLPPLPFPTFNYAHFLPRRGSLPVVRFFFFFIDRW